ncbi:MAG: hypothetical protein IPK94_06090 [Saprospiraceae bacterium]|nr:hypothetical protein [Saprospiraceae bacterium]
MSKKSKKAPKQVIHVVKAKKPAKNPTRFYDWLVHRFNANEQKIIIVLTVIALITRLYHIGFLSYWVDEYVYVTRAVTFLNEGNISNIIGGEKNGLAITILNTIGFLIFGKNEFGGRYFLPLIGAGLVPATYYFCKTFFSKFIRILTCLFVTFSQYLVFWARIDRQYGPISTFYILLILGVFCY